MRGGGVLSIGGGPSMLLRSKCNPSKSPFLLLNRKLVVPSMMLMRAPSWRRRLGQHGRWLCWAAAESEEMMMMKRVGNTLDIRVGKVVRAWRHEEAESLYVEEVDVGEPQPRTICSGLVNYLPLHLLQDINVVVLANLKPRNMRGIKSYGMLMAASDASHEHVELLQPPNGSACGERIWFGSENDAEDLPQAASPNQIQKKKLWELVQPYLRTDDSCIAWLGPYPMRTSKGFVLCQSMKNARIS